MVEKTWYGQMQLGFPTSQQSRRRRGQVRTSALLFPVLCTQGTGLCECHLSSAVSSFLVKAEHILKDTPNPVAANHHASTVSSPESPLRWASSQANMEHSQPKEDKVSASLNSLSKQRLKARSSWLHSHYPKGDSSSQSTWWTFSQVKLCKPEIFFFLKILCFVSLWENINILTGSNENK